jgi:hypothetical protein
MKQPQSAAKKREKARDRKAFARVQRRILSAAYLQGPIGQEYLDDTTSRRLANLESERRRL